MTNEFDKVMAQHSDKELIAILNSPEGDYQPAALEAAKRVFDKRNLSREQVSTIKQELKQKQDEDDIKANEPLETYYKVIAFIFPPIIFCWTMSFPIEDGYERKSRELARWHFYGFLFYVGVIALIFLWEFLSKR